MLLGSDERDDLDIICEAVVCQCHAKLEFKVGKDAQAAHNDLCIYFPGKFNGQTAIARDSDLGLSLNASVTRAIRSSGENINDFNGLS